ncbi:DUF4277 domain-containing protein [Haliscomenobacter hydrossis]|uniref:Transposase IS4 family protein n=1 Tax=Haliscomenobacter hydrossis (strain ATCC 27775 / DSM 1100 / LMG 10767 / O) TaxID=760192 RepID=F4L6Q0_HALH1|nr:DUF4277 domain-containing protein [Haliscomenobacter hydrossis]AEE50881.1 hypothetical protein Halhy_3018 [Haliscomenobacter hydrossis DSM 1100]
MIVEQVDDLPILGHQLKELGLPTMLEAYFPDHGHWQGLSGGQVLFGWLLYILSESDHRLCHVEDWAECHIHILSAIMDKLDIRKVDFCDDRLGRLLDRLSDDQAWESFECGLGKQVVEVYQATNPSQTNASSVVRSDSFNVPQFRKPSDLFRHGYSKQRRADLPFCKVMVGYIDSLGIPLAVDIVKGSGPDFEYYLSVINRIQRMLNRSQNLYVGDSQLGATSNRLAIHTSGNYYLCPLSQKQVHPEKFNDYLDTVRSEGIENLPSIFNKQTDTRKPAYFFEVQEIIPDPVCDIHWTERRLLVYSPHYAQGLIQSFKNRLDEAEEKIRLLVISKPGRRNPATLQDLHARIGTITEKYKVEGCFDVQCDENRTTITVQRHKDRPARMIEKISLGLSVSRKNVVIEELIRRIGWQIYGSNAPENLFSAAQLVKLYRDEYAIEHLFDYFINRDVGLLPIYLKKENRVKALIRLLSIAMKCSMLIQYRVRLTLQENEDTLNGIYPGNKGRQTDKPTAPMLLRAFKGVAIVCTLSNETTSFRMTALNSTQSTILTLLKAPDVYSGIVDLLKSISVLRET